MSASFLTQDYSFGPLNIDQHILKTIMLEHDISEHFLDVVSSFYEKVQNEEEAFCVPFQVYESSEYIGQCWKHQF